MVLVFQKSKWYGSNALQKLTDLSNWITTPKSGGLSTRIVRRISRHFWNVRWPASTTGSVVNQLLFTLFALLVVCLWCPGSCETDSNTIMLDSNSKKGSNEVTCAALLKKSTSKFKTNPSGPIQIHPNPTSTICERVAHKDEVPTSLVDTTKDPTMLDWKWPPAAHSSCWWWATKKSGFG